MTIIGVDGMPLLNKCTNSHHRENCERAQLCGFFFILLQNFVFLFSEISPLIMTVHFNDSWTISNYIMYLHDFVLLFN